MPVHLDCNAPMESGSVEYSYLPLNVVCVKYGTKYGADYVNKLFWGVKKHLSLEHTFTCFTEDSQGLDPEIIV